MNYTQPVVWCLLLAGLLFALFFGRKWSKPLSIAVGIAILLFVGMNTAFAACVAAKLCQALGDSGIVYTLYPFLAIPVYWFVAGLVAKNSSVSK